MKQSRSSSWPWIALGTFLFLLVGGLGMAVLALIGSGAGMAGGRVGLIEYSGVITDQGATSMLGVSRGGAREFISDVERAGRDKSIKAVVVRINSPGGSPAASQEMYQAIGRLRQQKPVLCSMGDAAASGGYYVAAACDKIYANASTVTGSIGVISQSLNFAGLLNKYGVRDATQKSGNFKDMGNPFGPINPAHQQMQRALIQNIYQQFVSDVLAGRKKKLTRAQLLKLADGRVFTGQQAKTNGLIDELGGLHETIAAAAKLGNVKIDVAKGAPPVKNLSSGGLFGSMESQSQNDSLGALVTSWSDGFAVKLGGAFADALVQRLKMESNAPALPATKM